MSMIMAFSFDAASSAAAGEIWPANPRRLPKTPFSIGGPCRADTQLKSSLSYAVCTTREKQ